MKSISFWSMYQWKTATEIHITHTFWSITTPKPVHANLCNCIYKPYRHTHTRVFVSFLSGATEGHGLNVKMEPCCFSNVFSRKETRSSHEACQYMIDKRIWISMYFWRNMSGGWGTILRPLANAFQKSIWRKKFSVYSKISPKKIMLRTASNALPILKINTK